MTRRRRRRFPGRWATGSLAALLLAAVAIAADYAGLFGQTGDDLSRYNDKTFAVVRHVDGDTFHINVRDGWDKTTAIRLWGVDTPETVKPNAKVDHFGPEASDFTKELTYGKPVRLELVPGQTRDRYDRLLAYAYLPDGRMLNLLLIQTGHGYADPRFDHLYQTDFTQAMQRARRQHAGLWAQVRDEQLPEYLQRKEDE